MAKAQEQSNLINIALIDCYMIYTVTELKRVKGPPMIVRGLLLEIINLCFRLNSEPIYPST